MQPAPQQPESMDELLRGIWRENPVFVAVLGMCPTLAVTGTTLNAIAMGLCTLFVLFFSMMFISALRNLIPKEVRIASYIVIIATFVTIVDYAVQAISMDIYKALGAYIQLIVANCILLGRAESHAAKNGVWTSALNATGVGLGFTLALTCIGAVREILGSGSLLGVPLFGSNFQPWLIMALPPGAFFALAGWLILFAWYRERRERKAAEAGAPVHAR